ncbi:unnamed protein product [Auanema sp. JU1783]|nr:unnamed protein product [Auanema sp. JU1783]
MADVQANMPELINSLENLLTAKKNLLQSVFTQLSTEEQFRNRAQIRDVLEVTPVKTVNDGIQYRMIRTLGFEDRVHVEIEIINNSNDYHVSPNAYILLNNSEAKCILENDKKERISNIKPLSKAMFFVSFPSHLLYNSGNVHLAVEYYLEESGTFSCLKACPRFEEKKRLDGSVFEIERPMHWKCLDDLFRVDEREAKELVHLASLVLFSETFSSLSLFAFRTNFSMFQAMDFGSWQCYIGCDEYKGLIVTNSCGSYGQVNLVYGRDCRTLQAIVARLEKLSALK